MVEGVSTISPWKALDVSFSGFCRFSKPTCLECGYLTIADKEIDPVHRTYLTGDTSGPYLKYAELTQCWRKQWVEYDKADFDNADQALLEISEEVEKDRRRCPFFFSYEPGLSPWAHAERQNARRIMWFGAAGGGLVVLAVELVKALLR